MVVLLAEGIAIKLHSVSPAGSGAGGADIQPDADDVHEAGAAAERAGGVRQDVLRRRHADDQNLHHPHQRLLEGDALSEFAALIECRHPIFGLGDVTGALHARCRIATSQKLSVALSTWSQEGPNSDCSAVDSAQMGPMEAALDVFAELVTREAKKGEKDGTTAVYTALMAACEKVSYCFPFERSPYSDWRASSTWRGVTTKTKTKMLCASRLLSSM